MKLIKLLICFVAFVSSVYAIQDEFERTIEDLIQEKIADNSIIIDLIYDSHDKIDKIKNKQPDISNVTLLNLDPKYSVFRVRIDYNNGVSDELAGKYNSSIEISVPSRFIKAGEVILASDVVKVKTKLSRIKDNFVVADENIIGMQAKKHLSPGMIIKSGELVKPAIIKINDPVNIIYQSNNIKLKTSGIALSSGAIGDNIKVKNEDSGTTVLGQIINKNTIQVSGE